MEGQSTVSSHRKGVLFAVMSGFLYGLLGYFGMTLMDSGLSVANLSFWRFFVAFTFLCIVFIVYNEKQLGKPRDLLFVFLNGALFYSGPGMLFFIASKHIGTGQTMVIFFVYPAFVMFFNWLFEKQPMKSAYFLSLAVILVGLYFLVDLRELSFDLIGISLSLLSAVSYAAYVYLGKKVKLSVLSSTLMVSLGCALTALFLALWDDTLMVPTKMSQWLHIVGIGIICSAIPILLLLAAIRHISVDRASLLSVLEPVFTVIFGVLLLGEIVTGTHILGLVLTLAGAMSVTLLAT